MRDDTTLAPVPALHDGPQAGLTERLRAHLAALEHGLLERQVAVRLLLLAALAGEHVLLIGPPGTAKSELARRLHRAFDGARYFERLLTRFSTPEELFGPLSLKALEDDRYERLIDGYLPTAGIAFLDEVFKSNSAILNALLTLLNEREFDNGAERLRVPLISVVGASNEAPADESLLAFHDRFLLRVPVAPVGDDSFAALLRLDDAPPAAAPAPITAAERAAIAAGCGAVTLGDDALQALTALRGFITSQAWPMSDRRWRQLVALLRCAVAAEGRARIDALDVWLVPYVAAPDAEAVPLITDWLAAQVVQAVPQDAPWLAHAVEAFEKQLEIELRLPADGEDDSAGKLALARALGGSADAQGGMARLVTSALQDKARRHFSTVHVAARVAQVDEVIERVQVARAPVQAALDALCERLRGRLWLPPALAERWCAAHRHTLAVLDARLARLQACRDGFAGLPVDLQAADAAPAAVSIGSVPSAVPIS